MSALEGRGIEWRNSAHISPYTLASVAVGSVGGTSMGWWGLRRTLSTYVSIGVVLAGLIALPTEASAATSSCVGGALCAWGSNSSGALGDGTTTDRTVPVALPLTDVTAVSGSAFGDYTRAFTLFLKSD